MPVPKQGHIRDTHTPGHRMGGTRWSLCLESPSQKSGSFGESGLQDAGRRGWGVPLPALSVCLAWPAPALSPA